MKKPSSERDLPLNNETLSNSDAARRALDFYLNPAPPAVSLHECLLVPREGLNETQTTEHAAELLRCAAATAHESANSLQGMHRDLALTVMHMINMARTVLEHAPSAQPRP
ncbi:DUF6124 family protein [Pseudomonas sp. UM16]|uniref:DUF6124 family protein n=1 Tax=Pseudomonas sp. UM16 TaxID=3158962 RepID=UPI003990394E